MANKAEEKELSQPVFAMMVMGIASSLLVGASFATIVHWPLPVSIAPYFEDNLFGAGMAWGLVAGCIFGWILGYLTDEKHFEDHTY